MKKTLLLQILLLFCLNTLFAQSDRVLVLKDKNIVIKNFTVGNYIKFEFSNRQWITGYISRIKADTIDVKQFGLQPTMTMWGTKDFDTIKLGTLILGIDEIRAFAKESNQYTSVFSNGAFLQTAGAGYFVVNVANSLIRKDPVFESSNLPKMGAGIGAFILGKIQAKKNPNYRPIGKRFSVAIL
ncbi:MAG: hypothetical protein ACK4V7_05835 [Chitinophagaceae bacterium]